MRISDWSSDVCSSDLPDLLFTAVSEVAASMADFFWFSDAQWARIEPLLPANARGKRRVDDRRVLSWIVHALKCGGRWADCPRDIYGPKKTLYNRFVRWSERGIWEGIFGALAGAGDVPDRLFIDSSCIKVHRCAGEIGRAHV